MLAVAHRFTAGFSAYFSGLSIAAAVAFSVALVLAPPARAADYRCQPEGMTDAEAARITEVAKRYGRQFRETVNKARQAGVNLTNDTTHADMLADRERSLKFMQRLLDRRKKNFALLDLRLDQTGGDLDEALLLLARGEIIPSRANYFALPLDAGILAMLDELGSDADNAEILFALSRFSKTGELKHRGAKKFGNPENGYLYAFHFLETGYLLRRDKMTFVTLFFRAEPALPTLRLVSTAYNKRSRLDFYRLPRLAYYDACPTIDF